MNICLLNDSFPPVIDGVANVVMNYGKILTNKLGDNVVVGTPRYPNETYEGYPYKVIAYPSLDTTDFIKGYRTGNPLAMREISQMAKFEPDIIHTHCPASSTIMARILKHETKAPIVFTYHTKFDVDIARAVGEGFLKKETIKAMVSNISACDDVWVVSEGAGENLKSLGYEGEYRVMSNGVDFPKGCVEENLVREVTKDYDLPCNIPLFLFVGRIMKYKGLNIIVDALKNLSEKGIEYRMVFVGSGADEDEIKERIKEYCISLDVADSEGDITHFNTDSVGKIIFTGPVYDREKLRAWNTRADLFLFPSVYDTNGIVVREAAACSLPSVLIKDSCAAEGITHNRNGYLIEESPLSMSNLLEELSRNLDLVHKVGQNAMNEIYISWEDSVRIAENRYKELKIMSDRGELEKKRNQSSDYVLKSASLILKGTEHVFDFPRNLYGGMKENIIDFKGGFKGNLHDWKADFSEIGHGLKHEIKGDWKELKEDFSDFKDDIKDKIPESMRNLYKKKADI